MNLSSPAHAAHAALPLHFAASLPCSPPRRPTPTERPRSWPVGAERALRCPTRMGWDDLSLEALPVAELASC